MDPKSEFQLFKDDLQAQLSDPDGSQTIEETKRSIQYLEKRLLVGWKAIELNENSTESVVALHNLARYAGWLLLMLGDGLGSPIEFYGWLSRGLFEVYVLALFVLQSEKNAHVFLSAATTDEITMLEGILKLQGGSPESETKLRATVEGLKARRGNEVVRLPDYAMIADRVGMKQEYEAFWKLYSKYVHPSSWVVNATADEVRNHAYQQIFQMQAQFNAHRVLSLVEKQLQRQAKHRRKARADPPAPS